VRCLSEYGGKHGALWVAELLLPRVTSKFPFSETYSESTNSEIRVDLLLVLRGYCASFGDIARVGASYALPEVPWNTQLTPPHSSARRTSDLRELNYVIPIVNIFTDRVIYRRFLRLSAFRAHEYRARSSSREQMRVSKRGGIARRSFNDEILIDLRSGYLSCTMGAQLRSSRNTIFQTSRF